MKPIEWTVSMARNACPGSYQTSPPLGHVTIRSLRAHWLQFSAAAGCGDETDLFLGLVAAFSASEGIRKDTGVISWVRWPSSVAIDGKTVATTCARAIRGTGSNLVVLDFAINISGHVGEGVTSLLEVVGIEVDKRMLLEKILESLAWMHAGWANGMHPQVLRRVRSMTETLGGSISVSRNGKRIPGVAADIDDTGRLVVRLRNGSPITIDDASEVSEL